MPEKLIRSTQRNVTWQTGSEYHRLTVSNGRTLNYVSFVQKIQIPEIFESPLIHKCTQLMERQKTMNWMIPSIAHIYPALIFLQMKFRFF